MAAWSVAVRLDKDAPSALVVPDSPGNGTTLYEDFWDETSRRYKSGVVKVTVDTVTLSDASVGPTSGLYYTTGSGAVYTSGETLGLTVQPPNYNPVNDTQFSNSGIQVAAGALAYATAYNGNASIYQNYCPINYGLPGPSALVNGDGSIQYAVCNLALNSNAFTDIVSHFTATVAGTISFTSISPYADIGSVGGGSYSLLLCAGPLASKKFLPSGYYGSAGVIGFPVVSGMASVAVQLQKVTFIYYPGPTPDYAPPRLKIANPGRPVMTWDLEIGKGAIQSHTLTDLYTAVFAANANLIDANSIQCGCADLGISGSTFYNLLNVWIDMDPRSGCSVGVKLDYKIAKAA